MLSSNPSKMFVSLNHSPIQSAKCFKCARKYIAILFTQIAERGVYKGVDMCMCGGWGGGWIIYSLY